MKRINVLDKMVKVKEEEKKGEKFEKDLQKSKGVIWRFFHRLQNNVQSSRENSEAVNDNDENEKTFEKSGIFERSGIFSSNIELGNYENKEKEKNRIGSNITFRPPSSYNNNKNNISNSQQRASNRKSRLPNTEINRRDSLSVPLDFSKKDSLNRGSSSIFSRKKSRKKSQQAQATISKEKLF